MGSRPSTASRIRGCLLGGAVGDALGAPVEFMQLDAIRSSFGPHGIQEFAPAYGRLGAITDDTQMTLFTAEGVLRSRVRHALTGIEQTPSVVHDAYRRWLVTQLGDGPPDGASDGWLAGHRALWSRRGPGRTCLSALARTDRPLGSKAENDSKGCGAIMRVAPVGLALSTTAGAGEIPPAFAVGLEVSACTHGHPSGYLAAAYFAQLIGSLLEGAELPAAIDGARAPLASHPGAAEVVAAIEAAVALAVTRPTPALGAIEVLGAGWVAEEALAIALYCALIAPSFEAGIRIAVNHGGDSDSTGSLTGQLLGCMRGVEAIDERWLAALELRDVIDEVARDLASVRDGTFDAESLASKYPGS